jgi:hypothetical protein
MKIFTLSGSAEYINKCNHETCYLSLDCEPDWSVTPTSSHCGNAKSLQPGMANSDGLHISLTLLVVNGRAFRTRAVAHQAILRMFHHRGANR